MLRIIEYHHGTVSESEWQIGEPPPLIRANHVTLTADSEELNLILGIFSGKTAKAVNVERASMKALEELTPQGSEFVNDPKTCKEWIRARLDLHYDMMVRKHIKCNKLGTALLICKEALQKCIEAFKHEADKGRYPELLLSSEKNPDGGWAFAVDAIKLAEEELK